MVESLKVVNMTKKYSDDREIIKIKNFTVEKGTIHVIEGKSGSGKSTFLSIIGGLEFPTNGKVYYNNESFYDLPEQRQAEIRGHKFGYVFQSFHLIPELTVRENIELPLKLLKKREKQLKYSIDELSQELGIHFYLNKLPTFLSGGEQQRVAIARALITEPDILFADEPTGNLDQITTKSITSLLTKFNKERELSLIIVTHEKNLIQVPHFLYSMKNGVLEEMS
ncbi:ABC transporter ATP-binding protein [Niallia sp. FSL K6-0212]|uniref:ABC transporter ATP-binding protein n=1 Tax=Niallia sp. FSL K6-0212 TaxID=2921423 RepID=UPI0030F7C573